MMTMKENQTLTALVLILRGARWTTTRRKILRMHYNNPHNLKFDINLISKYPLQSALMHYSP